MGADTLPFWSITPYYAFALAKQGRANEARAMAQRLTKAGRPAGSRPTPVDEDLMPSFDRRMIAAVVAALGGDEARASKELKSALGVLAQPGSRLVPPEYAFVELCEALTKETGVKTYRDLAVAFARGYEDYEPWSGWAYAVDAQYSAPGPKRVRAAALALKFDPQSARLRKLDPALRKQAAEWLKSNEPFKPRERVRELKS